MSVQIVKMTGEEFQRIVESSEYKISEVPGVLGISSRTMYNYFKMEAIPEDIELKLGKDRKLADAMNFVLRKDVPPVNQMAIVVDAVKSYGELAASVKATLDIVTQLLLKQETKYEQIAANNDHLIRVSRVHLGIIEDSYKAGELSIRKK